MWWLEEVKEEEEEEEREVEEIRDKGHVFYNQLWLEEL